MYKKSEVEELAKKHNINTKVVNLTSLTKGVNIEREHHCNLKKCFKVALDHVSEFPDYYDRLSKMEKKAEKYWKGKNKNIYLK
jgi:hypothetical protein